MSEGMDRPIRALRDVSKGEGCLAWVCECGRVVYEQVGDVVAADGVQTCRYCGIHRALTGDALAELSAIRASIRAGDEEVAFGRIVPTRPVVAR